MSAQSDFFVAGGTLRPSAPSYVRRPADDDLLRHLTAGEFCYVLTPRQMGKSSLMVRTAGRLRADGHRIAIIDLTSIGTGSSNLSADQWYLGLLSRMRNQLRFSVDPQTWWSEHASVGHAQRFITFFHDVVLVECTENVVILIDEIDSTLNLSFRDDFFAAIRAIYNERATDPLYDRLTFALFGVATPTDLIQDRERTPFNIGQRVELVEFTRNDALPLQEGLDATVPGQGGVLLDRIFYWTGGHPYLTQRLCQVIANQPTQTWNDETIDALVHATFLSEEGRKDTNLDFVQNRIASSPEGERRQMLRLYRRVWRNDSVADNDRSLAQNRLELYGLVQVVSGRLWVRNRIYQQVFNSEWIDSLMPPQRQRRLALLTASVALVLLFVVWIQFRSQPPPQCAAIADLFTGSTDSGVRLDALANLFNQGDRCRQTAFDLFYAMEPAEHEALFTQLDDPAAQQQQLVTVIDGLYRTLDTAPEHDAYLMQMWLDVLNLSGLDANHALVTSIRNWKLGRDRYANDDYVEAAAALGTAVVADHPALYYDHALAMIANQEYDSALQDLNAIVEIAAKATPTPTPEVSATATTTPSPISSPTAALPATRSSATTTDTAVAPQSDGIMTITAIQQTRPISASGTGTSSSDAAGSGTGRGSWSVSASTYRRRFSSADRLRLIVRQTLEEYPVLATRLRDNIDSYDSLRGIVDVALLDEISAGELIQPEYIFGIHDPGGEQLMLDAGKPGWIVFPEAIGADPNDMSGRDYTPWSDQGFGVIVQIQNGYYPEGTLPHSSQYENFAQRVANFVENSPGANIWVIGYEPNFEISRPSILTANAQTGSEREVITPERYAQAYRLARTAIHALPGHEHDQVLIAPPAPWNNQTTYLGNPNGDWVQYFSDILDELGPGNVDGITLHTYTHSGDPKAIRSESRLDPPFENRYFEFRTYRDFMNAIPAAMRALPVYITETNQDVPWVDNVSGWVQLAYAEINEWNSQPGNQKIHALVLYRWPTIDKWGIEGKQGVIDDFRLALQADYRWTDPLPSTETPPVAGLVQIGPNSIEPTITDSLVFQVTAFNPTIGTNDGDGIDNVQMQIVGPDGEIVYEKQENTPGYCAFGGGEPDCSTLVFSNNDNRWPDGQPVQGGLHTLRAVVNASRSVSQTLESTIRIQLPQQTVASFSGSCTDVATNLSDALSQCSDLNVGWACYAAAEVETSPIEFKFAQVGDRRPLSVLSSIGTLGGIAVINAQLAGEAEPVKLIAFGDTQIDAGHLVMLRTFDGELICEPAPPGLVILTDDSSAKSVIAVNGVELLVDGSDGDASLQQFVTLTPSSPVTTTGVDIRLDGTVAPVQQATTQAPSCRVVVNALNLRSGPGTVYVPPIGTLILDQMLIPIGRDGEAKWLQVNVGGAGQVGWVAADPNFIACNLDRSLLPIVSAPPTPMPTPISIPIQELTVGDRATVLIEANLRRTPGYFAKPDDDILTVIPANEVVTIIGGPSVDDQPTRAIAPFPSIWWRVSYEDASGTFLEGWLPIESIDFQPVLQQLDPARN